MQFASRVKAHHHCKLPSSFFWSHVALCASPHQCFYLSRLTACPCLLLPDSLRSGYHLVVQGRRRGLRAPLSTAASAAAARAGPGEGCQPWLHGRPHSICRACVLPAPRPHGRGGLRGGHVFRPRPRRPVRGPSFSQAMPGLATGRPERPRPLSTIWTGNDPGLGVEALPTSAAFLPCALRDV